MLLVGRTCPLASVGVRGRRASSVRVLCSADSAASSAMTVPQEARKLRILCLHGYLQNAEVRNPQPAFQKPPAVAPPPLSALSTTPFSQIFRTRIGSMRKALKRRAEFIFVDAPYAAEGASAQDAAESAGSTAEGRTWWQWEDLEPGTRPSRAARYTGWESSQAALEAALEEHGPVDGLLGFSQGATAAALFLAHRTPQNSTQKSQKESSLFGIFIGGFLPRDENFAEAIRAAAPLEVRSMHVSGEKDALVPPERSAELWEAFDSEQRSVLRHPGAHMVPTCSGGVKAEFVEFLDSVRDAARKEDTGAVEVAAAEVAAAEPVAVMS